MVISFPVGASEDNLGLLHEALEVDRAPAGELLFTRPSTVINDGHAKKEGHLLRAINAREATARESAGAVPVEFQ
jgi:hypothetical protein